MFTGNIGDGSSACTNVVSLAVNPGDSVTVANLDGVTIQYDLDLDGTPDGTIASPSGTQTFTSPAYLLTGAGGVTTIQISGGMF